MVCTVFELDVTSKNGKDEHAAKNNHGTWFYAQVIDFSLFTGDQDKAKQLAEESKKRLDSQLSREGKQPLELERTNGLGYSTMNLRGWFTVATLAEKTGVDLWNYHTSKSADCELHLIGYCLMHWEKKNGNTSRSINTIKVIFIRCCYRPHQHLKIKNI